MNQPNQNNNPDSSGDVPSKRKRGRPRKYPRPEYKSTVDQNRNQNPVGGENAQVPPRFGRVNGNEHHQKDQENARVGQLVSGVIEATFDAGYLLSVRVGNSDTTLRGLVFKPGRYVPISPETDVAPGVPLIQRNEVPFPSGTYTQVQNPLPKERNEQYVNIHSNETPRRSGSPPVIQVPREAASSSNLVASLGKNVPYVAHQTTHPLTRGNVVSVLLQPVNSSNGALVSNQPSQVMTQASIGSGKSIAKEIPVDGNQAPSTQTQTRQSMLLLRDIQSKDVPRHQSSANMLSEAEAKSMILPSMPFEKMITEVVKRIQAPSINTETDNSESGGQTLANDSSSRQKDKFNDIDQPILIKPLQTAQSGLLEHSASDPKPSEDTTMTSKMKAFAGYQNGEPGIQSKKSGSGQDLDAATNLKIELEDGETDQLMKLFRSSNA